MKLRCASLLVVTALGLTACQMGGSHDIPASARIVSEGNRELSYTAPERGTAYVYDDTDNRILWSGRVDAGDKILLSPDRDRLTLDGRTVLERGVDRGHQVRIYFDRR